MDSVNHVTNISNFSIEGVSILLLIIISVGAFGGLVNYYIERSDSSDSDQTKEIKLPQRAYVLIGIASSMLVPLFLYLTQSKLLDTICDPKDCTQYLIFGGYCLVVAITGRKFIVAISDRILKIAKEAKDVANKSLEETQKVKAENVEMKDETSKIKIKSEAAIDKFFEQTKPPPTEEEFSREQIEESANALKGSDPNKGSFGGSPLRNGRVLRARVVDFGSGWYNITLRVQADENAPILTGIVEFVLHPTFPEATRIVQVLNGIAQLSVNAWGAFTVGAIVTENSGNTTLLELDLARDIPAPEEFRRR